MNQLIMYWNLKLTLWFQYFLTILRSKEFDYAYHGIIRSVRSDPDIIARIGKKRFLLLGESFPISKFVESTFQLKNGLVTYVFESGIRALLLVVSCDVSHVIIHFHFVIDACLFNLMCSWNVNCWCLLFFFFLSISSNIDINLMQNAPINLMQNPNQKTSFFQCNPTSNY